MSHMKNYLLDKLEKAPITKIGKVSIQQLDKETFYLTTASGEGAAFTRDCLEKVLTDFFYSNF